MKNPKNFKNKKALVIGAGSIGTQHVQNLLLLGFETSILEIKKDKKKNLMNKFKIKNFFTNKKQIKNFIFDLIIIANYGPNHYQTLKYFINISNNFLIEKPLTNSVENVDKNFDLAKNKKKNIYIHHQRNFYELTEIKKLFKKYHQTPKQVICFGGNTCLVTTGIHIYDLVCELYNDIPEYVLSDIVNDKINPRGKKLYYISGSLKFYFKNGKMLTFEISNMTNIKNRTFISSEYFSVETNGREIFYNKFNPPKAKKPNITIRYKNFKTIKLDTQSYYYFMIRDLINKKIDKSYYEKKKKINKTFLSLMQAKKLKKEKILLLNKKYYKKKYNVS